MDEDQLSFRCELQRVLVGRVEDLPVQHHLATEVGHRLRP